MEEDDIVSVTSSGHGPLPSADTEASLAHELNKLSVNERIAVLEDIHGVASPQEEDARMVEVQLLMMEDEIQRHLKSRVTKAYRQALEIDPGYVQAKDTRLMFLRADDFDVPAATQRFLKFLQYKLELFGKEKMCREIQLVDLSPEDMKCLDTGALQELRKCDRSGRAVLVTLQQLRYLATPESQMRAFFYIAMTLVLNRPEIQKKGIVVVTYNNSSNPKRPYLSRTWKFLKLRNALPFKHVAWHFCHSHAAKGLYTVLHAVWWRMTPSWNRVRTRKHKGLDHEILRQLQCFGIPTEVFPVSDDGTVTLEHFRMWIQNRRHVEEGTVKEILEQAMEDLNCGHDIPTIGLFEETGALEDYRTFGSSGEDFGIPKDLQLPSKESIDRHGLDPNVRPAVVLDTLPKNIAPPSEHDHPLPQTKHVSSNGSSTASPILGQPPMAHVHEPPTVLATADVPIGTQRPLLSPITVQQNSILGLTTPKPQDVLLGRGKPTLNHPGNIQFRQLLERHREEYECAPKYVKSLLARNLVEVVTSSGSRFLKPTSTPDHWVLADTRAAQAKVAQFFRSQRAHHR